MAELFDRLVADGYGRPFALSAAQRDCRDLTRSVLNDVLFSRQREKHVRDVKVCVGGFAEYDADEPLDESCFSQLQFFTPYTHDLVFFVDRYDFLVKCVAHGVCKVAEGFERRYAATLAAVLDNGTAPTTVTTLEEIAQRVATGGARVTTTSTSPIAGASVASGACAECDGVVVVTATTADSVSAEPVELAVDDAGRVAAFYGQAMALTVEKGVAPPVPAPHDFGIDALRKKLADLEFEQRKLDCARGEMPSLMGWEEKQNEIDRLREASAAIVAERHRVDEELEAAEAARRKACLDLVVRSAADAAAASEPRDDTHVAVPTALEVVASSSPRNEL
jgi:hypothetical protein